MADHEYLVEGHANGKAIVSDEEGILYYLDCEPNEAPTGTVVSSRFLKFFDSLSEEEKGMIKEKLNLE